MQQDNMQLIINLNLEVHNIGGASTQPMPQPPANGWGPTLPALQCGEYAERLADAAAPCTEHLHQTSAFLSPPQPSVYR